jgi:hypothetical protein
MSEKVVGLHGRAPLEPNGSDPEVVQILEHWLDRARSGELAAVGLLCVRRDGHVFTVSRGRSQRHALVACCEYLKHDLCAEGA